MQRTLRALILLCLLLIVVIDWLPFYVDLQGWVWDEVIDLRGSYYTPIGLLAATLACIVVLVALAGARAPMQSLRPCAVVLRPDIMIHAVNVLVLALVIPWWWRLSDADASDLIEGWGYISGKACKLMMGLCLLPIARQSLWLHARPRGWG